jgi:hypothetical protein
MARQSGNSLVGDSSFVQRRDFILNQVALVNKLIEKRFAPEGYGVPVGRCNVPPGRACSPLPPSPALSCRKPSRWEAISGFVRAMGGWSQWLASDYNRPRLRKSARCALTRTFAGRGYARALTKFLAAQILAAGKIPFLHVKSENGAKVVYEKIGFRLRAAIYLSVISLR